MQNERVLYIEIETIDNGKKQLKRLDGLSIRAKVSRKRGSLLSEGNISIANLKSSDIEYLTTYTSPYINPSKRKKLNIYAGYSQTGYGRIFTGDIYKALPSDLPDTWLNIEAKSLYYQNRIPISYSVENMSMKENAQSIANNLGLQLDWQATTQKNIEVFNFTGSLKGLINKFNKTGDVVMFEDNGKLKVQDKIQKPSSKKIKLVSEETGLIGLPEPDQFGVKFKCLCDVSVSCGDWISLKSKRLASINGNYQVYTLDFDVTSREQAFYSIIYAKRYGIL